MAKKETGIPLEELGDQLRKKENGDGPELDDQQLLEATLAAANDAEKERLVREAQEAARATDESPSKTRRKLMPSWVWVASVSSLVFLLTAGVLGALVVALQNESGYSALEWTSYIVLVLIGAAIPTSVVGGSLLLAFKARQIATSHENNPRAAAMERLCSRENDDSFVEFFGRARRGDTINIKHNYKKE